MNKPYIELHPKDDVLIACGDIPAGTDLTGTVRATAVIAAGLKVSRRTIARGAPVHRYNQVIGFATADIQPGEHVHTHNLEMGQVELDYAFCRDARPSERDPRHPNIAHVIVVGLGCEISNLGDVLGGAPGDSYSIQAEGGTHKLVEKVTARIDQPLPGVNAVQREPVPLAELKLALQCGGSAGRAGRYDQSERGLPLRGTGRGGQGPGVHGCSRFRPGGRHRASCRRRQSYGLYHRSRLCLRLQTGAVDQTFGKHFPLRAYAGRYGHQHRDYPRRH